MSETRTGQIVWTDLTVPDAERLRDFYTRVVGWRAEPVDMGGYADFNMLPSDGGAPAAGVCFARGGNANLPPYWLIYVSVESLDASVEACRRLGGTVVNGPRSMGERRYCIIQDPAGAYVGLIGP